ncbi:MAG: PAS domain S-box protein, partial [Rhodobacteraceae bacterium]|nr:PAS domain S-box protein [Paracoccaceae bacterium]
MEPGAHGGRIVRRLVGGRCVVRTDPQSVVRTADGRTIPVESRVQRVEYRGQEAILRIVRDLSALRTQEEQLREAQRREEV